MNKNLMEELTLKYFEPISIKRKFKKNSIIFYEDDISNYIYILEKGEIRGIKAHAKKEELLHYFNSVIMIGEVSCIEGIKYPFTAIANKDCEILVCHKKSF